MEEIESVIANSELVSSKLIEDISEEAKDIEGLIEKDACKEGNSKGINENENQSNKSEIITKIAISDTVLADNSSEVSQLTITSSLNTKNDSIEMDKDQLEITEKSNDQSNEVEMAEDQSNAISLNLSTDKSNEFEFESNQIKPDKPNEIEMTENKLNKSESVIKLEKPSEAIVKIQKPLCADYRSASESESESDSCDSEKDSEPSSSESDSYETDSDLSDSTINSNSNNNEKKEKKPKKSKIPNDLLVAELPPIEDLKISVPEEECQEIGVVSSIVDSLVVVESYKGTAPLDIDSILFLDKGNRSLGKVFDVIGPVGEPVYTIRFTNADQIKEKNVEKGMKVYCAPKTEHSNYVFLPDLLKMKGSDASWKDNMEPPSECQDFSDDEEEQRHRSIVRNVRNENNRRRNPDSSTNQDCEKRTRTSNNYNTRGKYIAQSRFNNPYFQRHANKFTPGTSWSYHPHTNPAQPPQSSPSFTQFPNPNPFVTAVPSPYPNNPLPFGTFRFPNIRPFPPGNFLVNAMTPPPPPPPTASSVQTTQMSYPTRTTGPPPFSSFMTPQPANRMPIPPFPFNQGFPQQQTFYSQPVQFNPRPPPPPPPPST